MTVWNSLCVAERGSETGQVLGNNTELTDSVEQCLSCEADSYSATADIPRILWNILKPTGYLMHQQFNP